MGVRIVKLAEWEHSQQYEEWTITDWKATGGKWLEQIANEVHGFGLEVEMREEGLDNQFHWRIVAIKTEPDDPYAGM